MTPHFIGTSQQQLFAALHHARGRNSHAHQTIVICPPIGHEYIRTHWCLRLLARQLSRKGINVLRLDYRGIGDSAGHNEQTISPQQWHQDVQTSIDFAKEKTDCRNVLLLGVRYGASIAAAVAKDNDSVNGLILWEPVTDTESYLQTLRKMHHRMVDLWVCKLKTINDQKREEILGSLYARSLLEAMENQSLDLQSIDQPQFIVDLYQRRNAYSLNKMQKFMPTEDENSWSDLKALETGWLRASTARQIALMADDMFYRLQKFEQIGSYAPAPLPFSQQSIPTLDFVS
jgi:pimeloyl-ACP methyl ester carboxylesterase